MPTSSAEDRPGAPAPEATREVPVDWEALEDAFENNAPEVHSYLHLTTGEVLRVVDGVADPQMHVRIASDGNYLRIDPVSSREQYRWMERFIPMAEGTELREKLGQAIDGKGAFRRFKDVLMTFATERERWFTFRSERLRTFMEAWLAAHAIKAVPRPVWVDVPPAPPSEAALSSPTLPEAGEDAPKSQSGRRTRNADSLRVHLKELADSLGPRDLDMVVSFGEFLRARRAARGFAHHHEHMIQERTATPDAGPLRGRGRTPDVTLAGRAAAPSRRRARSALVAALCAGVTAAAAASDASAQAPSGRAVIDRAVVRFYAPETGGTAHPRFIDERTLAFETRLEALAEGATSGSDGYPERLVRGALEHHVTEELLAGLAHKLDRRIAAVQTTRHRGAREHRRRFGRGLVRAARWPRARRRRGIGRGSGPDGDRGHPRAPGAGRVVPRPRDDAGAQAVRRAAPRRVPFVGQPLWRQALRRSAARSLALVRPRARAPRGEHLLPGRACPRGHGRHTMKRETSSTTAVNVASALAARPRRVASEWSPPSTT